MSDERKARREAILRCKGELPIRTTAELFGTTIAAVKSIWYDIRPYTRRPQKWRCHCGALAMGSSCHLGHAAPWVTDDQQLRQEIDHLPPETDECPED